MIHPKNLILCFNECGRAEAFDRSIDGGRHPGYRLDLGANFARWKDMDDDRALQVIVYMALDIVRQYEVDANQIFSEILKVEGMDEYLQGLERDGCLRYDL
jgi:hypothetical protein